MKNRFWKKLTDERGVTFVETIVSLILLSLLMISLFRLSTSLIPGMKQDLTAFTEHNRELMAADAFRRFLGDVRPPWWLPEYEPEQKGNTWDFPWYKGMEEDHLVIGFEEEMISFFLNEELLVTIPSPGKTRAEWISSRKDGRYFFTLILDERQLLFPLGSSVIGREGDS